MTDTTEQDRLLEQARGLAATYEAELAQVTEQWAAATRQRDQAWQALSAIRTLMLAFTDPLADDGDVVGVEDLPVGDPWADVDAPAPWHEPAVGLLLAHEGTDYAGARALPDPVLDSFRCVCRSPNIDSCVLCCPVDDPCTMHAAALALAATILGDTND